jgi:hypothetical protein
MMSNYEYGFLLKISFYGVPSHPIKMKKGNVDDIFVSLFISLWF